MKKINLENIKVGDLLRYQNCMRGFNYYSVVKKVTKAYIILEDGTKFRKDNGWGTGYHNNYLISGINDQENCYEEDVRNLFYY